MRAERRSDGSLVVRDDPRFLRESLYAFGSVILIGVATQSGGQPLRLVLGGLCALLCFVSAALLESVSFEFDRARRVLRWSRRDLFRRRASELPFAEIESVDVVVREDRERDGAHVRIDKSWRIQLATRAGPLQLTSRTFPDEAEQTAIANEIRESLGLSPRAPVAETVEDLAAAGERIAAVRLARVTRGLSLEEAKELVDSLREKPSH